MKIRTRTVIILLALASACFGQEKKPPIAIDCTFNNLDPVKLGPHLGGFSNTKVAPEKIVFWRYSRPEFNPKIQYDRDYVVLGNGFGHITKQTDWRDFGAKLRKIASDHRANVIGYEFAVQNSAFCFSGYQMRNLTPPYAKKMQNSKML